MDKTLLNPPTLVKPTGYAHGLLVTGGRWLFIAGQTGLDANGQILTAASPAASLHAQFQQALHNIQTVVTTAGGQMTDLAKLTIFVTDLALYQAQLKELGAIYRTFFGQYYPPMAVVEVKSLWDPQALIEIESIAVLG